MKTAADVLKFWFEEHGPDDWFAGKAEFDAEIARGFAETHAAVARGEAWDWRTTPDGRLAEIIVLDQFSRQLFRDRAEAFASDPTALVLAQEMVGGGHHNFLPLPRRGFVLMPFMHSESKAMQRESLRLHTALGEPNQLKFAEAHAELIKRFGRFPKRNAALGRTSTPEELAYIAENAGSF
ncbi:MAG TPA: DUF924 family protein [Devosia sp.]|nr:DUF924 family protein [Devosia sp.]